MQGSDSARVEQIEQRTGLVFQDHQRGALEDALEQVASGAPLRLCLYHRTGAGKTYTALATVALAGCKQVLVLAPPITRPAWQEWGRRIGIEVEVISHAKFRQKTFRVTRTQPMIVDEFHLLGGHTGVGWKKLDRIAAGLQAPLVIASATPNYNDAERVYCIQHVLNPDSCRGGYLQFLFDHCITLVNPFGSAPLVEGFLNYRDAEDYLKHLDRVHYVEDELIKQIDILDKVVPVTVPDEFFQYGLDRRRGRIIASQMEERHAQKRLALITDEGLVQRPLFDEINRFVVDANAPVLIYCNSREVAKALERTFSSVHMPVGLITGGTSAQKKEEWVEQFRRRAVDVLIGTATLATGLDGVDKMCDHLLIVDDTDDDALRRQLMGRILPRGLDVDVSTKTVTRLVYEYSTLP